MTEQVKKKSPSHRSYYILFVLLGSCMAVLFADDVAPVYYDWSAQNYIIPRTVLRDDIKPGEALSFLEYLPNRHGHVCIVAPGTGIVMGLEDAQRAQINSYLQNSGIDMSDSEWALVYVDTNQIEVNVYPRSKHLWLASVEQADRAAFPVDKGFERKSCVPIEHAVLMKSYLPDEHLIEFGAIK